MNFQIKDLGNDNYNDIIYVDENAEGIDEIITEKLYNTLCSLNFASMLKAKRYLKDVNIHLGKLELSCKNSVNSYETSHRVIFSNKNIRKYPYYEYNFFRWNEDKYRQLLDVFQFYFEVSSPIKISFNRNTESSIGVYVDKKRYGRPERYLKEIWDYLCHNSINKIFLYDSEQLIKKQLVELENIEIIDLSQKNKEECILDFCACKYFVGTASPFVYIARIIRDVFGVVGCVKVIEVENNETLYSIAELYPKNINDKSYEAFCNIRKYDSHMAFSKYMGKFASICFGDNSLVKRMVKDGIRTVSIYGLGTIGKMLYFYLQACKDIRIEYIVDKNITEVDEMRLIKPTQIAEQKKVDAIIVTPIFHVEEICQELKENGVVEPIIPLEYYMYI